ncbi:Ankyrin repeat family protein, partial [Striga hermonthica]
MASSSSTANQLIISNQPTMASSSSTPNLSFLAILSTVNVANFVSIKLSGSNNYGSWKLQMHCLIQAYNLVHFIDRPIPEDDGDWMTERVVLGWILGSLTDAVLKRVANSAATARDVWVELDKNFSGRPQVITMVNAWDEDLVTSLRQRRKCKEAKEYLERHPEAICAQLTSRSDTCLHLAVATGDKFFHDYLGLVKFLVKNMPINLLTAQNSLGDTVLHVAARNIGFHTKDLCDMLSERHHKIPDDLMYVANNEGDFPCHQAARVISTIDIRYFIEKMDKKDCLLPYLKLLCMLIDAQFYDEAKKLFHKYPELAGLKLEDGTSALQRLVLLDTAVWPGLWDRLAIWNTSKGRTFHAPYHLSFAREIMGQLHKLEDEESYGIYVDAMLTAIENRSEIYFKEIELTMGDKVLMWDKLEYCANGDFPLHLVARLAPPHKLNLVSGAALQMQRELQWFQEVEKEMYSYNDSLRLRTNYFEETAEIVFTKAHQQLKVEGEKWMKDTASSCTIAAALIATVVFTAAITVPGGNESSKGYPVFSQKRAFVVFAVSDAVSLFTSTTSLLMFLSILTSRYAEIDFLYALPKRLCIGLFSLFVSILFMMVAFSATLYLVF